MKRTLSLLFCLWLLGCGGSESNLGGVLTDNPGIPNPDPTISDGSILVPGPGSGPSFARDLSSSACGKIVGCGLDSIDIFDCTNVLLVDPHAVQSLHYDAQRFPTLDAIAQAVLSDEISISPAAPDCLVAVENISCESLSSHPSSNPNSQLKSAFRSVLEEIAQLPECHQDQVFVP